MVDDLDAGIADAAVAARHLDTGLSRAVTTDENGLYEVLLPSTYQANCPIPSGICPGMYVLRVNDPGDLIPNIPPDAPVIIRT